MDKILESISSDGYIIYNIIKPYIQKYQLQEFMYCESCFDYKIIQKSRKTKYITEIKSKHEPILPKIEKESPIEIPIISSITNKSALYTIKFESNQLSELDFKHKQSNINLESSTGYNIEIIYNHTNPEYSYICIDNREVLTNISLKNKDTNTLRKLLRLYDIFLHKFDFKVTDPNIKNYIDKIYKTLSDYESYKAVLYKQYFWWTDIEKDNHNKYAEFVWKNLEQLRKHSEC